MERFFSLKHLTDKQLRDLYRDARKVGKLLVEYDQLGVKGHYEIAMPEDELLKSISVNNQNYLVFHEDFEDCPDATTIAFPLAEHPFTTAYIDIDNSRLDWFVKEYELVQWWQMEGNERKHYTFAQFYTLEPMKRHRWN